jgi:VWFA-related protein
MRFVWLLLVVLANAGLASAQNDIYSLKVDVSLITVDVQVFDGKGQPITTLSKEDFLVYEDGVLQKIQSFSATGEPYSVLLLADRSYSMQPKWSFILEAMNRFVKKLRQQDRVAIGAFDSSPDLIMKWRSPIDGEPRKVDFGGLGMGTDLYGALSWAVKQIQPVKGRKTVVTFTDGGDERLGQYQFLSRAQIEPDPQERKDFQKTLKAVWESDAPFYFVSVGNEHSQGGERLKELSKTSGGRSFFPSKVEEIAPVYERIARDMGSAYTLAYASNNPSRDGRHRKIQVQPLDVRLHVAQSRDGYDAK